MPQYGGGSIFNFPGRGGGGGFNLWLKWGEGVVKNAGMKWYPLVRDKIVVVTGASSGIGLATAQLLQRCGWRVLPTVRQAADFDRLQGEGFEPVMLDLADEGSVERAVAEILGKTHGRMGAIVNNAGYGQPGALEDVTRAAMRQQFETNVFGTLDFTRRFIPIFRQQRVGRIILVSSVVGRVVIPLMGAYCASKFAVEAMGDSLRLELGSAGISVSILEPGPIASNFRKRVVREAGEKLEQAQSAFAAQYEKELSSPVRTYRRPTDIFRKPPEAVAKKIIHGLESPFPHVRYPVTGAAWLGSWVARYVPARFTDWVMRSRVVGRAAT